jgi:hypothetical protein
MTARRRRWTVRGVNPHPILEVLTMLRIRSRFLQVALTATAATALAGGIAVAGIPSADGTFHGCVDTSGELRMYDAESGAKGCDQGERPIAWNQQGPAGPKGATGATGATGPKGATGPAGPSFARGHWRTSSIVTSDEYRTFVESALPAGNFVVTAKLDAFMREIPGSAHWGELKCRLRVDKAEGGGVTLDTIRTDVSDNGPEYAAVSLMGLWSDPGGGDDVRVECKSDGSWMNVHPKLGNIKLMTQEVGGYTVLAD